jgi:hypothetical protein
MAKARSTIVMKTDELDAPDTRRVGFILSADIDYKLSLYARKHRTNRSKVVEDVLGKLLSHVVISFRDKPSKEGEAA